MESIRELFELLQIKSGVWESSAEENKRSDDASSWTHSESDSLNQVLVKKESESIDDDEKEEGEIKDDEDEDVDDSAASEGRSSSPNPVNLSLNTKTAEEKEDSEKDGSTSKDVSPPTYICTCYHTFESLWLRFSSLS